MTSISISQRDDLHSILSASLAQYLPLSGPKDIATFDASLGLDERGWVNLEDPSGAENWQILSPVRMHVHGVHELNRWIQRTFRGPRTRGCDEPLGTVAR